MKNVFKLIGIIAIVAVIGFSMFSCDNGSGSDSDLNGAWSTTEGGHTYTVIFNNGNATFSDVEHQMKGTYTTSGGIITSTMTHIWTTIEGQTKWYSKDEILVLIPDAVDMVMFEPQSVPYSISGNTLILGGKTYTRSGS